MSNWTEPRLLRYADLQRYLWGDNQSGLVVDWYYGPSTKLHMAMFSLPPGGRWRHSEEHKSFYDADECYYLIQGSLTFHNPQSGEVHVLNEGEALHFRGGTWHYGYNFTSRETLILCGFAPVPADITAAGDLALAATPLTEIQGGRWELLGDWPWNRETARAGERIRILRPADWLHTIQGQTSPVRVSLFVSTGKLTMGTFGLLPGTTTDVETHPGDELAFVVEGRIHVYLPGRTDWFELNPRDGVFVPEGVPHRYANTSDQPATVIFCNAPRYR